jgi:hypothetical protein
VFTLNRAVNVSEDLEVFVNNIQQEPGVGKSYTASGTTLTFDAAPSSGTANVYVVYRGLAEVTTRLEHDANSALAATTGTFSGNVGIGTAAPNEALTIEAPLSGDTGLAINYNGDNKAGITVNPITGQIQVGAHPDLTSAVGYYLSLNTAASNTVYERLRIDSFGKTFVTNEGNVSDNNNANLCVNHSASTRGINLHTTGTGGSDRITFQNDNGTVGTINTTGSSTSYGTSSDYRLKTAVEYDWDATTRLKQLKPARFEWIVDGDDAVPVDGFLAHEVQDVVPEAITGTKDGMRDEEYEVTPAVEATYDDEGNVLTEEVPAVMGTRSVPDYQGIDQAKLVPLLVKTIQELEARIAALEAN